MIKKLLTWWKSFTTNRVKMVIYISDEGKETINQLKTTCDCTEAELINSALSLFIIVLEEYQNGNSVGSVDETVGMYKELAVPALVNVRRNDKYLH